MFSFSKEPRALKDCTVRVQLAWALGWVAEVASCRRWPAPAVGVTDRGHGPPWVAPATRSRTVSSALLQQAYCHVANLYREAADPGGHHQLRSTEAWGRGGFPEAGVSLCTLHCQ